MSQRDLIQSALEKLGPEKVKNALMAFTEYEMNRASSERCFLGQAFGGEQSLLRVLRERCGWQGGYPLQQAADVLGITVEEVNAIVAAFDDLLPTQVHHDELQSRALAYLATQQSTVVEEPEDDDLEIEVLVDLDDDSWEYESDEAEEADVVAAV